MSSLGKEEHARRSVSAHWAWLRAKFDNLEALRQRLDYQTYLLAAAGLVASLLLGFADLSTRGPIAQRQEEDMLATLEQVLPKDLYDNDLLHTVKNIDDDADRGLGTVPVYVASKAGEVSAIAFRLSAQGGYSGPIDLVMGIDRKGAILGVRVVAHAETPGLGDKIEKAKSDWILAFTGRSLDNTTPERWKVKKDGGDFDQFAGATITPRAVVRGVQSGLAFFQRHRDALLSPTP